MSDRITKLREMLASEPDDPFCLYGLAQEYARLGDVTRALAHYDEVLRVDPDHCYAYFHKARVQEDEGEVAAAIETLQEGLERANAVGDAQAINEISAYLDELS